MGRAPHRGQQRRHCRGVEVCGCPICCVSLYPWSGARSPSPPYLPGSCALRHAVSLNCGDTSWPSALRSASLTMPGWSFEEVWWHQSAVVVQCACHAGPDHAPCFCVAARAALCLSERDCSLGELCCLGRPLVHELARELCVEARGKLALGGSSEEGYTSVALRHDFGESPCRRRLLSLLLPRGCEAAFVGHQPVPG